MGIVIAADDKERTKRRCRLTLMKLHRFRRKNRIAAEVLIEKIAQHLFPEHPALAERWIEEIHVEVARRLKQEQENKGK